VLRTLVAICRDMIIEIDRPDCFPDFIRLNEAWISEHFEIEVPTFSLDSPNGVSN